MEPLLCVPGPAPAGSVGSWGGAGAGMSCGLLGWRLPLPMELSLGSSSSREPWIGNQNPEALPLAGLGSRQAARDRGTEGDEAPVPRLHARALPPVSCTEQTGNV